ncbi:MULTISPECIES: translation initiation factor IF-2 subunit beta [unclassified Archaeoglobus]|uniref:translation initiation factor IF-2 subunit beta n=1 Tax=unclassified Archaeoglobus TaxID=2643606 RepID=UPI0025BE0F46|nr:MULTISPECIES: translation initiation factor IF-2 subunit beta [unclassified Archaeoglobus]
MRAYEELLERALEKLANKDIVKRERFEIPRVSVIREGARTTLKNFSQIARTLNRSEDHLYKYIVKSLGTAGFIDNGRLILQGKFTENEIQKEIDDYVRLYVLCRECNSPDTEFVKEERVLMIRCLACGAKHPVRNI